MPDSDAERPVAVVVDDEPIVRMCVADMLEELGFVAIEAESGAAALDLISERDIDLLVTDHRMPEMTGGALVARVLALKPATQVVIASGANITDGIDDRLPRLHKPFSREELVAVVTRLPIRALRPPLIRCAGGKPGEP